MNQPIAVVYLNKRGYAAIPHEMWVHTKFYVLEENRIEGLLICPFPDAAGHDTVWVLPIHLMYRKPYPD